MNDVPYCLECGCATDDCECSQCTTDPDYDFYDYEEF